MVEDCGEERGPAVPLRLRSRLSRRWRSARIDSLWLSLPLSSVSVAERGRRRGGSRSRAGGLMRTPSDSIDDEAVVAEILEDRTERCCTELLGEGSDVARWTSGFRASALLSPTGCDGGAPPLRPSSSSSSSSRRRDCRSAVGKKRNV